MILKDLLNKFESDKSFICDFVLQEVGEYTNAIVKIEKRYIKIESICGEEFQISLEEPITVKDNNILLEDGTELLNVRFTTKVTF